MQVIRRGALRDVLAALYLAVNVSAVTAIARGGVHQGAAPPDLAVDYVVVGPSATIGRWDSMQNPGEDESIQIDCIGFGPDAGNAHAAAAVVMQLLDRVRPVITTHQLCIACRWTDTTAFPTPDVINGITTWKVALTFQVLVDQVS